jgi:hypothetical protein
MFFKSPDCQLQRGWHNRLLRSNDVVRSRVSNSAIKEILFIVMKILLLIYINIKEYIIYTLIILGISHNFWA